MTLTWSVVFGGIAALMMTASGVRAQPTKSQASLSFDAPRAAVRMAGDIEGSGWPSRLSEPSAEGQFEVLVRKDVVPVAAPHCSSRYLVVRMPATMAEDAAGLAALTRKRRQYADMLAAYSANRPIHFDTFAGPYGKRLSGGKMELSGCNLFFLEPAATGR